jgi:hypothetical protein
MVFAVPVLGSESTSLGTLGFWDISPSCPEVLI